MNQRSPDRAWQPLRVTAFRRLWLASVASHFGTWVHSVGAAWLMTTLAPRPTWVAAVQVASALPWFLMVLPAGALADVLDRRRLLLFSQAWMLLAVGGLAAMSFAGSTTPQILLVMTFLLGVGAALNGPAWQAIVPELVGHADLAAAVALNSLGFNLARAAGPALGGALVAWGGPAFAFALNSLSFVGVLAVIAAWRREPTPRRRAHLVQLVGEGLRYATGDRVVRGILIRAASFLVPASAVWALLPLLARERLGASAVGYGALLAAFGCGAVLGAVSLPRLRARWATRGLVTAGSAVFALALGGLALLRQPLALALPLVVAGAAWVNVLASFNVGVQIVAPAALRGRTLSVYMLVFFGGMAVGSALWGVVGERLGVQPALAVAALMLTLAVAATARLEVPGGEAFAVAPSRHWPTPPVLADAGPPSERPSRSS